MMEQQKNRNVYLTPNTSCLASSATPQKQNVVSHLATHVLISFLFTICVLLTLPLSAHASVITKPANNLGLVGYWNFNEGTSTYAGDGSANDNRGTLTNMANPPTAGSGWGIGKFGKGLNFDGVNDYVRVADNSSLQPNGSSWSIALWAKPENVSQAKQLLSKRQSVSPYEQYAIAVGLDIRAGTSGKKIGFCYIENASGTEYCAATTNDIADGNWHHIGIIFNNNDTYQIYIDGILQGLTVISNLGGYPTVNNTDPLMFNFDNASNYSNAPLDEVRIYNRALSATEVAGLYKSTGSNFGSSQTLTQGTTLANGIVGHWTFDGSKTTNTTALDSSGQNNTGTFTGFTRATNAKAGKLGQGMSFDGVNDYVRLVGLNIAAASDFTFCSWVYPIAWLGDNPGFWRDNTASNGTSFNIFQAATGRPWIRWNGTEILKPTSGYSVPLNTWTYVCYVVKSSTNAKFYADGVEKHTATHTTATPAFTIFNLGFQSGVEQRIQGLHDDYRIYNRALSASEVKQLYNLGSAKAQASSVTLQQGTTLANGIVGHWTFDGSKTTNTTALDSSGQGNTGTFTNFTRATNAKAGKLGQGMSFDGVNDYALVTSTAALRPTNNFTINAWAKFTDFSDTRTVLMQDDNGVGDDGYGIRGNITNGKATFFALNANGFTAQSITSVAVMTAGQWYHLTGVYRNSVLEIYINGVLDSTKTASGDVVYSVTTNLNIGRRGGTNSPNTLFMKGSIDDVRIYNRALSAGEVKQLYLMGR